MHQNSSQSNIHPKYEAPFYLLFAGGARIGPIETLEEVFEWPCIKRGANLGDLLACEGRIERLEYIPPKKLGNVIVKDALGRTIARKFLMDLLESRRLRRWNEYRARKKKHWTFRSGAVPNTGRFSGGSWFRQPRTTSEMRAWYCANDNDEAPRIRNMRPRRAPWNLTDARDDNFRSKPERNWKEYRRTQYKQTA